MRQPNPNVYDVVYNEFGDRQEIKRSKYIKKIIPNFSVLLSDILVSILDENHRVKFEFIRSSILTYEEKHRLENYLNIYINYITEFTSKITLYYSHKIENMHLYIIELE